MTIEAKYYRQYSNFILDVNFTIPQKGITAIFGPSGCGKTTILRAIAGLNYDVKGMFQLGAEIWQSDDIFLPPHKRSVGYVFQESSLFPHLSVLGNLKYAMKRTDNHCSETDFNRIVKMLGIAALLNRNPANLSGGEKQRVAIARALLRKPQLLLMDEPMASLDQNSKQEIIPFLENLHRELEIPILYVSHSVDEVARLADHIVILKNGKIEAVGPVQELFTRIDLSLAHGEQAEAIISASVEELEPEFNLAKLRFPGGCFYVSSASLVKNQAVRLRILARDVSITLEAQQNTSILNIFPARIKEISGENETQLMIQLDLNGINMLAKITRKSAQLLALESGKQVYVQVKSVAVLA